MARNTRINQRQLNVVYWPNWRMAEKVLLAAGFSKQEAEEKRKEIHQLVTGSACSSKDLTNRTLDKCLSEFAKISMPKNGKRQADLADGPAKRVRHKINRLRERMGLSDAYVETIAIKMHRRAIIQMDEAQLLDVLKALQYHENRHPDQPVEA